MHMDHRWLEVVERDGFFNPGDDLVAGSALVIAEIVIKADLGNALLLPLAAYAGT